MNYLCLHGWGFKQDVLAQFTSYFSKDDNIYSPCLYELARQNTNYHLDSTAQRLSDLINKHTIIIAWSISGLLAIYLSRLNQYVRAIVLVSAPPCFVNKPDWRCVLDPSLIEDLKNRLLSDPEKTLKYFAGLSGQGDLDRKTSIRLLRKQMIDIECADILSLWLDELKAIDLRKEYSELTQPCCFLMGDSDALLTPGLIDQLKTLNSNTQYHLLQQCGHAPFINHSKTIHQVINGFLNERLD